MNRDTNDDTNADIATADAAGQPVASRLREAQKQLGIVLDAIEEGDEDGDG